MIQLQGLTHGFSGKILFDNVSFAFPVNKRVLLIGNNGTGKTTLFRLLTKKDEAVKGNVVIPQNVSVGLLDQDWLDTAKNEKILDVVLQAFQNLFDKERELREIHQNVADGILSLDKVAMKIEKIENELLNQSFYGIESNAKKILTGLGFSPKQFHNSIDTLSGGWKMRVLLARLLLEQPDFLLLDEPTNHLDIESLKWLETFLKSYPKTVVAISHDRTFINNVAEEILELDNQTLTLFKGDLDEFEEYKMLRDVQVEKMRQSKLKEIAHMQRFIDRFRYKNTKSKQVQSRIKMLEKIDIPDELKKTSKEISVEFNVSSKSAKRAFVYEHVTHQYDSEVILEDISGVIYRGDRIAIVGANGAGKSTFINLLTRKIFPSSGKVTVGERVNIGYYNQNQLEELNPENTILYEVESVASEDKRLHVRSILGAFLFSGEDIFKKVGDLSGGEKAKVLFAKLISSGFNTLVLDEPTNHLDMSSVEQLQLALGQFDGTLLIISHDRNFLDGLADTIYLVKDKKVKDLFGGIDKLEEILSEETKEIIEQTDSVIDDKDDFKEAKKRKNKLNNLKRKIEQIEKDLDDLEQKKAIDQEKMNAVTNHIKLMEMQNELDKLDEQSLNLLETWESMHVELEQLTSES